MNHQNEDIQNNLQNLEKKPQDFNPTSQSSTENQYLSAIKAIEEKYEKLHSQLETINQKNSDLEKAKNSFEEKSQKYALLYKDELNEKKEWQNKFVSLQEKHTQKIEDF